jgi:hypothetical protein
MEEGCCRVEDEQEDAAEDGESCHWNRKCRGADPRRCLLCDENGM